MTFILYWYLVGLAIMVVTIAAYYFLVKEPEDVKVEDVLFMMLFALAGPAALIISIIVMVEVAKTSDRVQKLMKVVLIKRRVD